MRTPAPTERLDLLLARRNEKMARSPHAFVRGNTIRYYEWLQSRRGHALPKGPPIWICGDCHLGNLGPLANDDGQVSMQIRDFDQTTIGNPVHDLIRLALSLATAARNSSLPGVVTAKMLDNLLDGYTRAMRGGGKNQTVAMPEVAKVTLGTAVKRSWKTLAKERIYDVSPTIPLGKNFWRISRAERDAIKALCQTEELRRLVTRLKHRDDDAAVKVLDAAYWVKGCSSLGMLRYAVLLGVGDRDYCLIDMKEAVCASSPRYPRVVMPRDNARRVQLGACNLAPQLGERMLATRFLDHGIVVRELLPQDQKLEIDRLSLSEATGTARYLAYVVGCAHARQMQTADRQAWLRELSPGNSKVPATPTWLWQSVVHLLSSHEAAYLDHCRKYGAAFAA